MCVRIFVVSLHRTGTQSVHDLFLRAGLSAMHWPAEVEGVDYQSHAVGRETDRRFVAESLRPVFARFRAVSDVPIAALYDELDRMYPDARFVAVSRKPREWLRSVRRHVRERPFTTYERVQYWRYLHGHPERLADVSDDMLMRMHREHHAGLRDHFRGRPGLGLFRLGDRDLGPRICTFCGVPSLPLRHVDYMSSLKACRTDRADPIAASADMPVDPEPRP